MPSIRTTETTAPPTRRTGRRDAPRHPEPTPAAPASAEAELQASSQPSERDRTPSAETRPRRANTARNRDASTAEPSATRPRPHRTPPLVGAAVAAIRAAERVSPALAAELAMPLFRTAGPRLPVRPDERGVHDQARRSTLRVRGRDLVVYEWGTGAEAVLLVHGWQGRAAQFAPIIRELRVEGLRLVAFDAPANGDSPGRRTDIRDLLAAMDALHARHGRFRAIIGHSFGALAAAISVREGTAADRLVAISGLASARSIADGFAIGLGLGRATADALADRYARRVLPEIRDPYARFDAAAAPVGVPLLVVHDRGDRKVPASEGIRLHEANPGASRLLLTEGRGHARILADDAVLDAVTEFIV